MYIYEIVVLFLLLSSELEATSQVRDSNPDDGTFFWIEEMRDALVPYFCNDSLPTTVTSCSGI